IRCHQAATLVPYTTLFRSRVLKSYSRGDAVLGGDQGVRPTGRNHHENRLSQPPVALVRDENPVQLFVEKSFPGKTDPEVDHTLRWSLSHRGYPVVRESLEPFRKIICELFRGEPEPPRLTPEILDLASDFRS